ncbi:MAG TPA: S8 family peptidase [Phytomonospora sp.]
MKIRSAIAAAGVTALVISGGTAAADPGGWAGAPSSDAAHALDPAEQSQVIELITGDRVLLQSGNRYAFLPADGRENVGYNSFTITRDGVDERFVVPRDAVRLLADGKLDRRLFNVTALAADGFAGASALPLIVQYENGKRPAGDIAGADRTATLSGIDAAVYAVAPADAEGVWAELTTTNARALSNGYRHVWLDGRSKLLLDQSVPQVGAPVAWEAGYTGTGITVGVLDTGYDPTHPDLAGRVSEAKDFTGTSPGAIDGYGHGTHVASTVAGTGAASNGKYKGVAPDAKLLIGKVCDDGGSCADSDIIAGMQWAADEGAAAVNLSLGGGPTDGTDPLSLAVNEISLASGTLFVIAAGNDGADEAVSSPATADEALAVGSVTKSDELSEFSSRGPRFGDGAVKPDISAPGSDIVAARAAGTEGPAPVDEFYTGASGTSMATPHVAGAAALLKQAHPDWTARQLKSALMSSSKDLAGLGIYQEGAGRLDIGRGVSQDVTTDVGSLSFGKFAFPHGQPAVSKKVTYTNGSDAEITLALDLAATAADGTPAPAGVYAVDKTSVTIPAGGTAEATVTFNPIAGSPHGAYSGVLTATSGDIVVRTAAGGVLEQEMHDLTVKVKPRTGTTVEDYVFFYFDVTNGEGGIGFGGGPGDTTVRVPPGTYEILGSVWSEGPETSYALFARDVTVAHADVASTFDQNKATRHSVGLADRTGEKFIGSLVTMDATSQDGSSGYVMDGSIQTGEASWVLESAPLQSTDFLYMEHPVLVSPDGAKKPYRYELNYITKGKLPKGTTKRPKDSAFTHETAVYHGQGVKTTGERVNFPELYPHATAGFGMEIAVPSTIDEYYQRGEWSWSSDFYIGDLMEYDVEMQSLVSPRTVNRTVNWNQAPLTPSVADWAVGRFEDYIGVGVPMFSGPTPGMPMHSYGATGVSGTTSLSKDGQVLGTSDYPCLGDFELPAGTSGRLTLACEATRSVAWSKIGTKSSAVWTFDSSFSPEGEPLNLSAVRMGAAGVVDGYAPVGATQAVTLDVERGNPDVNPGTKSLKFEVSYDEGRTWKAVTISRTGDHATASLKHPAGATSVSVRFSTTDKTGQTSVHTTIKAYGLK